MDTATELKIVAGSLGIGINKLRVNISNDALTPLPAEIEKMLCTFEEKAKTHRCEDTGQDRLLQNWAKLKSVIHRAKKVIAMDAFTTKTTIESFENIEREHSAIESYFGQQIEIVDISTPPSPRFFKQYETKYDLIAKMCDSLDKARNCSYLPRGHRRRKTA